MSEETNKNIDFEEDSSFDWKEWALKIIHFWWILAIGVVVGGGLAYVKNRSWKPQYKVNGEVIIGGASQAPSYSFMTGFNSDGFNSNNDQLVMFGRDELIARAVESLPINIEYYTQGRFKRNYYYGALEPISITTLFINPEAYNRELTLQDLDDERFSIKLVDKEDKVIASVEGKYDEQIECSLFFGTVHKNIPQQIDNLHICFRDKQSLANEFAGRLSFSIMDGTSVAVVSLIGERPERDVDFINALSNEFVNDNLERKNMEAIRTIEFIDAQLQSMSDSLDNSNEKIRSFRKNNKIVNVESYMNGLLAKNAEFKTQEAELNIKEAYFKYLEDYLTKNAEEENILAPSSLGISDPTLLNLTQQINDLQVKRASVGKNNPYYEKYTKELDALKNTLYEVLKNVNEVYKMDRENFKKQYADVQLEIEQLSDKEAEMLDVERQHQINNNYYTYLLQKRSEAQIRKASNVSDITILQKAKVVDLVNGSIKRKNYMTYLFGGLFVALLIIIIIEYFNNTIKTSNELEKLTHMNVLSSIPQEPMLDEVITTHALKSVFTESFRMLRTRIEFITQKKDFVTVAVTSPESGDGKTYFSINLAGIYSLSKKRTLLIDMDLRKPSIAKTLGINKKEGLSNVIIGDCTLDEAIIKDNERGFDVLLAGAIPPNPSEIIASEKLKDILSELKERYEYLIIDTSPVGLVGDCYPIIKMADVALFLSLCGKTNKAFAKDIAANLRRDKISNIYAVLNGVKAGSHATGYTSYYYTKNRHYYTDEDSSMSKHRKHK